LILCIKEKENIT